MRINISNLWIIIAFYFSVSLFGESDIKPEILIQQGHSDWITKAFFSPDGKNIISVSRDKTIKVWSFDTGKLIQSMKGHKNNITHASITSDGNFIVTGGGHSEVSFSELFLWNIKTGEHVRDYSIPIYNITDIIFSKNNKYFYAVGCDNSQAPQLIKWNIEKTEYIKKYSGMKYKPYSLSISPDEKKMVSSGWDWINKKFELLLWDMDTDKIISETNGNSFLGHQMMYTDDGKMIIESYLTDEKKSEIRGLSSNDLKELWKISDLDYNYSAMSIAHNGNLLAIGKDNEIRLYNIKTKKEEKRFNYPDLFPMTLSFSSDDNFLLAGGPNGIVYIFDSKSGKILKSLKGLSCQVLSVDISPDGKKIITSGRSGAIKQWDIERSRLEKLYKCNDKEISCVKWTSDGKNIISAGDTINLWDTVSSKSNFQIREDTSYSYNYSVDFSPDDKYFTHATFNNVQIKVSKTVNGEFVKNIGGKSYFNINVFKFSHDGKYIFAGADILYMFEVGSGQLVKKFDGHHYSISAIETTPDGKKIITGSWDKTIKIWDISSGVPEKTLYGHMGWVTALSLSTDGTRLLSGSLDGDIILHDIGKGVEIKRFKGHSSSITSIKFFPDNKYLLSGSRDSTARIWNIETGEWTLFIANDVGTEWLILDDKGYWDSSQKGGELVAMVKGLECWNIDQFAVKNNRPDLIYAKLPFKDDGLIEHYKNQYLKRLKKLGFVDKNGNPDESLLSKDYHVPEAKIVESKINGKFVELKIELSDSLFSLKRYNVFVNDVPLFGAYGKSLDTLRMMPGDLSITERVELTTGANKIEVSCMNEKGAESYRALTMVSFIPSTPVKPDLYYIGFGVSKYIDPEIRQLGYADKDAKDLEIVYSNMKSQYANIYTKTYLNEECTVENIKKAKEFLKSAKPDDTFVLFIAGHGIHDTDKEATYYFVTHETKLDNLSQTAANFDIIEDIMQGIPPRNKLFLMDTCESGEIDDDVQAEYFTMAVNRGIKSRAIETERALKKKDDSSKKTTKRTYLFEKDRYIYNDLVRRSGAIVFSSCKGGELSYESDEVGNGFFTSKIIESLKGATADTDKDGKVSVDELKNFVIAEVPKLADGKQNPTVDRDNIYQKFGFQVVK